MTDESAERYEQRYSIDLLGTPMRFVRRPVAIEPPDGTVCFVDNGSRYGAIPRHTAGLWQGGKWKRVKFEPTHWTHWEDRPDG